MAYDSLFALYAQRDWESILSQWATAPSQSEIEKCERAVRMVREAIRGDTELDALNPEVFAQGSYANRTNTPQDSDVDICVRLNGTFWYQLPAGITPAQYGFRDATISYEGFKSLVERALKAKFGSQSVNRGDKAITVRASTARVSADVVATLEHRRYGLNGPQDYERGAELRSDSGKQIINWPEQNYSNGIKKNDETDRRFKAVVRILKNLRAEMEESGISSASKIPSYLVECLIWNVPNERLLGDSSRLDLRRSIVFLYTAVSDKASCNEWGEVNERKYLFRDSQPWKREDVVQFLHDAWNYTGFRRDET